MTLPIPTPKAAPRRTNKVPTPSSKEYAAHAIQSTPKTQPSNIPASDNLIVEIFITSFHTYS